MDYRRHSTGLTMVLTALLAVGLSLLPIPDSLRPLPDLRELPPAEATLSYAWPKALKWLREQESPAIPDDPALVLENEAEAPEPARADAAVNAKSAEKPPPTPPITDNSPAAVFTRSIAGLPVHERNEARKQEALARKVGTKWVDIIEGCRKGEAEKCEERALDPFFQALTQSAAGTRTEPIRVIHLGDSLIASDHISDMIRARLEARHGSGGRGFLFVDRPTRGSGRKVRVGEATSGWDIIKITDKSPPGERLGFSGVSFIPKDSSQKTSYRLASANVAELFYLAKPEGGALGVKADGDLVAEVRTSYTRPEVSYARVQLPRGAKTLEVSPIQGSVELFGVALENGKPGVILESIGLPGATAEVYLRPATHTFTTQLARRNPSMVLMMLGGNEAHELGRGWTTLKEIREHTEALIQRVRQAVPSAACLVVSPMDAGVPTVGRKINIRKGSREVGELQKALALEYGCAYWDLLSAMGGEGAIVKWVQADLMLADLVHPRGVGGDLVGHLFDLSLERARLARLAEAGHATGASAAKAQEAP